MKKEEKDFLRKANEYHKALLAPVDLFNVIGQQKSEKIIQKLIAEKYIDEIPQHKHDSIIRGNYIINFYRISKKGHAVFCPIYKKFWLAFKRDIRTIIISMITASITAIITFLLTNYLKK